MIDISKITFLPHHKHNPDVDILSYQLDIDTSITYCIWINAAMLNANEILIAKDTEILEIYFGGNYNIGSNRKSYSNKYVSHEIPKKYKYIWLELKEIYKQMVLLSDLII